jgi:transketolase
MAMAQKWLADNYNTDEHLLFDYDVYAVCSDGDLMEGVACEAASLAGHLKLDNLCWLYDDNHITIEGDTDLAFSENVGERFEGLGWNVVKVDDANDLAALKAGIDSFKACSDKPTLIIVKSIIGFGAPNKQDTHGAHGAPLGWDEIALAKENYGLPADKKFYVPEGVREHFDANIGQRGAESYAAWSEIWTAYQSANPDKAKELQAMFDGDLPEGWDTDIPSFEASEKGDATKHGNA